MAYYSTTGGDVYRYWVTAADSSSSTLTGTSYEYTNDSTWTTWTSDTTHPATDAWYVWNTVGTVTGRLISFEEARPVSAPVKTQEQIRAEVTQREINKLWGDIRIMEEHRRKEEAELTAQQLLEDLIPKEQLELYRETNRLVVRGRQFDYVIQKNRGVYKVEKDKIKDLCIHLKNRYGFPASDNVIGLKLFIEANEREFLQVANDHGEVFNERTKSKVIELVKRAA